MIKHRCMSQTHAFFSYVGSHLFVLYIRICDQCLVRGLQRAGTAWNTTLIKERN